MRLWLVTILLALPTVGLLLPSGRDLDRQLVAAAATATRSSEALEDVMRLGTKLGAREPVLVGLFLPAAFGTAAARLTAATAFLSVVANQLATSGLKYAIGRPRPDGDGERRNSSFPSAHASGIAGLAWIVSARHRRWLPWMLLIAIWISSSRVFLERHYVSDVLAGALLGVWFAALALHWQGRIASWIRSK